MIVYCLTVEYIVGSILGTKQLLANPNAWFLCYVTKRGGPTKSACLICHVFNIFYLQAFFKKLINCNQGL